MGAIVMGEGVLSYNEILYVTRHTCGGVRCFLFGPSSNFPLASSEAETMEINRTQLEAAVLQQTPSERSMCNRLLNRGRFPFRVRLEFKDGNFPLSHRPQYTGPQLSRREPSRRLN
jgi:hypothetical protein